MSKIVQAVNAMLSNSKLITDVMVEDNEYFFLYKSKYKWSIKRIEDEIILWFYPGNESLQQLIHLTLGSDWQSVPMIRYSDKEIGTKEAKLSFVELYNLIKEKVYGVDDALDDIISDLDADLPF
ncbi:hypothetical protein [Acinetobacter sp. YK3]|uniref:hypothetical protein n=1 Tax=Acinetobacter sp. YK3 TaxID=1860097 RepID=UPI00084BCF63|nr:hypothetical protein [Acinetobacter sp. YK3]OEC90736.1 hypothetical protein A9Z07_03075 [Acinetobacter sp. YK3]